MFLGPGQVIRSIGSEQFVKYVNFPLGAGRQRLDVQLDRGKTVDLEFVDDNGQPVENAFVSRIGEHSTAQLSEPRCTIYALAADQPRKVIAVDVQRGLLGAVMLTGDETSPVRVTLAPSASFRGRAVDASGEPLANVDLLVNFDADDSARYLYYHLPTQKWTLTTDNDGRFAMRHVVPGEIIRFAIKLDNIWLETQQQPLAPGQNLNLGNVTFAPPKPNPQTKAPRCCAG